MPQIHEDLIALIQGAIHRSEIKAEEIGSSLFHVGDDMFIVWN